MRTRMIIQSLVANSALHLPLILHVIEWDHCASNHFMDCSYHKLRTSDLNWHRKEDLYQQTDFCDRVVVTSSDHAGRGMMWKRLNFANRTRENLVETPSPTYEDEFKSTPYAIPSLQFNDNAPQPVRQPLPIHPHHSIAASSIYSQYPPAPSATLSAPWQDNGFEISPPSTPDPYQSRDGDDGGVSPIEELLSADEAQLPNGARYPSQIPKLRKLSAKADPRADALLREPIMKSAAEDNSSLHPASFTKAERSNSPKNSRYAEQLQKHGNFAARAQYFANKGFKAVTSKSSEPWSRTTGRATMVDAVQDTPQPRVVIPRRDVRGASPITSPNEAVTNTNTAQVQGSGSEPFPTFADDQEPTLFTEHNIVETPTQLHYTEYFKNPQAQHDATLAALSAGEPYPDVSTSPRRNRTEDPTSRFSWTTYATGTTHQTSEFDPEASPPMPPPPMPADMQSIMSRKSVQRKEVGSSSPSPAHAPEQQSILDRKRPIARDDIPDTPKLTSFPTSHNTIASVRKPVGAPRAIDDEGLGISTTPAIKVTTIRSSTMPVSGDAKSKALPKAPGLLSATLTRDNASDQITELRQQIDDISLRRSNVNRAIQKLTSAAFATQNPILTDWRTAKESEKKVDSLKAELADIGREEYELGLKLHRAYKRSEREGGLAGTSALWVRRVTS